MKTGTANQLQLREGDRVQIRAITDTEPSPPTVAEQEGKVIYRMHWGDNRVRGTWVTPPIRDWRRVFAKGPEGYRVLSENGDDSGLKPGEVAFSVVQREFAGFSKK